MKLKKLLAAVTATALAVTTMAVTSFTASADGEETFGTTSGIAAKSVKVDFSISSDQPDWTYKYQNINVIVKTWNNAATAGDWLENGIGGSEQEQYFGAPKKWIATYEGTRIDSSFTVDLTEYDTLDELTILYAPNDAYDFAISSVKAYSGAGGTGEVVWSKDGTPLPQPDPTGIWIKESAGVYYFKAEAAGSDPNYEVGATKPAALKVPVDEILVLGKTAADIKSITASIECTGSTNGVLGGNTTADGGWTQVAWDGSTNDYVKIENMYDFSDVSFQVNYAEFGDTCKVTFTLEYKEGGDTPTYTLTPATATIKTGLSNGQVFTLEGYTAEEQIDWDIDSAYAAKYVGSENGLENNQCKIVGTAVGGPVTLTAKSLDGDVLGIATITFTDSTTPPDPGHTHTPADTWTSDATGHWHACSGCTDKVDFAAHTFDSGEITTPPTETTTGVKTYKCTVCEYTKTETIPATGTNPPSHTHIAVSGWSSDSANHWHVCSECGEKFDSAAHTSDSGTVTVPATETTTGVRTYKCTVCGYVMRTETIPATGTNPDPSVPSGNQGYTGGVVIPFINNSGVAKNTPVISDDNSKSGWDAIASEIAASGSGSTISVDMNGATKVPSSIFREIEGLDIDLVLNMGRGIKWTVNGLSVTSHKNIDFGVSKNTKHIPNDVVSTVDGTYKRQISLDHNGTFGCTASMTIDIGTRYDGLYANLFYYNPKTDALEFADCSLVSGGNAKFVFTHASDYVITVTAEPLGEFEDVSSAAGISSESSSVNSVAPVAVLAAIVLGFGIVVYRKRRHN